MPHGLLGVVPGVPPHVAYRGTSSGHVRHLLRVGFRVLPAALSLKGSPDADDGFAGRGSPGTVALASLALARSGPLRPGVLETPADSFVGAPASSPAACARRYFRLPPLLLDRATRPDARRLKESTFSSSIRPLAAPCPSPAARSRGLGRIRGVADAVFMVSLRRRVLLALPFYLQQTSEGFWVATQRSCLDGGQEKGTR